MVGVGVVEEGEVEEGGEGAGVGEERRVVAMADGVEAGEVVKDEVELPAEVVGALATRDGFGDELEGAESVEGEVEVIASGLADAVLSGAEDDLGRAGDEEEE